MLSRIETGRKVPDVVTVRALAALYRSSPAERERLVELVSIMEPARLDSRLVMQRGNNLHFQQRMKDVEASSGHVRSFHPGMVLGVLQTVPYALTVFTAPRPSRPANADPPAELAASRASRYPQLAADGGRSWTLIQTEGALNWHVGSPAVMVEQLAQIAEACTLPHVRLGIIPARTLSPVFAPHGFHLYDARAALIATKTATALSTDQRDLDDYLALFAELEKLAVFGEQAVEVIRRVSQDYQDLQSSQ